MLSKDPSDVGVCRLLHGMLRIRVVNDVEEWVVGEAVEKGSFADNLVDRMLDGRGTRVGNGVEVHG